MQRVKDSDNKSYFSCYIICGWLNTAFWVFFFTLYMSSADFFKINFFKKNLSEIPLEWQTVWIQIRPDILSGLIWVQTVCKGDQQTALVGKGFIISSLPKMNCYNIDWPFLSRLFNNHFRDNSLIKKGFFSSKKNTINKRFVSEIEFVEKIFFLL